MAVFDKKILVKYIASKYKETFEKEITPIKLQKALYLLFAHYGGMARNSKKSNAFFPNDELLFDAEFKAWDYGPVETSIYYEFKNNSSSFYSDIKHLTQDLTKINSQVLEYVDFLLPQIFEINDFKLVEITHLDKSWSSKFVSKEHDFVDAQTINNDEIIDEYASKKRQN